MYFSYSYIPDLFLSRSKTNQTKTLDTNEWKEGVSMVPRGNLLKEAISFHVAAFKCLYFQVETVQMVGIYLKFHRFAIDTEGSIINLIYFRLYVILIEPCLNNVY